MNSVSRAMRKNCLQCMSNQRTLVESCESMECSMWRFRLGKDEVPDREARAAIRTHCMECFGYADDHHGSLPEDIQSCGSKDCALWKHRGGRIK